MFYPIKTTMKSPGIPLNNHEIPLDPTKPPSNPLNQEIPHRLPEGTPTFLPWTEEQGDSAPSAGGRAAASRSGAAAALQKLRFRCCPMVLGN